MEAMLRGSLSKYHHFIRYSLIGFSGVGLDFLVFLILFNIFGMDPIIANFISTSCGIINNFFLNRHLNFKKKDFVLLRFLSFYATGIVGILLSSVLLRIFHDYAHIDANIVKFASIIVVVITQYFLNKKISFGDIRAKQKSSLLVIGDFIKRHKVEILLIGFVFVMFALFIPKDMLGVDESDNFLSAKLILSGQLPHLDFFSHHMPTSYFISTIFYLLANGDILGFRVLFTLAVFAWVLGNFWLIRKYASRQAALVYLLLTATAHGALMQYMLLAETFILLSVSTAVIALLCIPIETLKSKRWIIGLSILLALVPLLAISYVYIVALLYILAIIRLWKGSSWHQLAIYAGIAAVPYALFGLYLVATRSLHNFLFENLAFNAKYYSPFFGDMGSNPVIVAFNIAKTTLGQINTIVTDGAGHHLVQLALLICFLLLPLALWLNEKRAPAVITALLLLFANARVGLFGPPAIENSFASSISQHAELYRGLAILFASLAVAFLFTPATKRLYDKYNFQAFVRIGTALVIALIAINTLSISVASLPPNIEDKATWTSHKKLPNEFVRIINSVASENDSVWVGPSDFLDQSFIKADRASYFTFFLPWHHICPECHDRLYRELQEEKPVVISWKDGNSVPNYPTPDYDTDMHKFLENDYFQVNSPNAAFKSLYFYKDSRTSVLNKLKEAGYEVN